MWRKARDWLQRGRHARMVGELVAETEAALVGKAASYLSCEKGRVPAWARLNRVAHGGLEDLALLAAKPSPACWGRVERTWAEAEGLLAREVLRLVGGEPSALALLQHEVLVPLELNLVHEPDLAPTSLVRRVMAELELHAGRADRPG